MAPKQTIASAKAKELQTTETPLVRRLKNIKNAKVQEGSWKKLSLEEISTQNGPFNSISNYMSLCVSQ